MQNLLLDLLAKPEMFQESNKNPQIPVVNQQAQGTLEPKKSSSNGLRSHLVRSFFETDLLRFPASASTRS